MLTGARSGGLYKSMHLRSSSIFVNSPGTVNTRPSQLYKSLGQVFKILDDSGTFLCLHYSSKTAALYHRIALVGRRRRCQLLLNSTHNLQTRLATTKILQLLHYTTENFLQRHIDYTTEECWTRL